MDDEFALCWNNFQDNIAAGFQNLYDRGDLVDVTLACDGKLLQAHKIVLAICSPYFQEMFITNPCKHPIIVLKDVGYSVMSELLQFMYQGVVNVKHTELSSFMKIAQTLQIKGLTTSSSSQKSPSQTQNSSTNSNKGANNNNNSSSSNNNNNNNNNNNHSSHNNSNNENQSLSGGGGGGGGCGNIIETRIHSSLFQNSNNKLSADNQSSSSAGATAASSASGGLKRLNEFNNSDSLSIYSKRPYKRNSEQDDNDTMNTDSMDHMSSDEVFLPPIPQISMIEPKFDLNSVKRELGEPPSSPGSARSSIPPPPFNFDYNYPKQSIEYPNELNMSNDYSKGAGNHMDIPPGGTITMLSSTSLLHGNCIFNRNNTVATQQGMKTYWLCKSYRITMCRARCITHQGRVISATGVHNHQPHMKGHSSSDLIGQMGHNPNIVGMNSSNNSMGPNPPNCLSNAPNSIRMPPQNSQQQQQQQHQHQQHPSHMHPVQPMPPMTVGHPIHHPHHQNSMHQANNAAVIQNMMQNVLSQNNLMHLSNMAPMLNTLPQQQQQQQQHTAQLNNIQAPSSLQITPIMNTDSPTSRNSNTQQTNHHLDSPGLHSSSMNSPSPSHSNNNNHHNNHNSNNMDNSNNNPIVSSSSIISVTTSPIDECPSVSQDSNNSSQSNMISSITISPTQPSFKMESL